MEIDWGSAPKNEQEHQARWAVLQHTDIMSVLSKDPRDMVLTDIRYRHPKPFDVYSQIDGGFEVPTVLAQLVVADLMDAGLVARLPSDELCLTPKGQSFVASRLDYQPGDADYGIKEGAPVHMPFSPFLENALKHLILHGDIFIRHFQKHSTSTDERKI